MRTSARNPLLAFDPIPQMVVEAAKRMFFVLNRKTEVPERHEIDLTADFL